MGIKQASVRVHGVLLPLFFISLCLVVQPVFAEATTFTEMMKQRSRQWNDFIDNIYKLHERRIKTMDYYTKESIGGYGGTTNDLQFYREVSYFEKDSGRPLSVIRWERKHPENLHGIELFVYDEKGRILREYSASFLPTRRAAPFDTRIIMHYYKDGLHSQREFDASDENLYEQCIGIKDPTKIYFALHYEDIPYSYKEIEVSEQKQYRACFDHVAKSAAPYTNPLSELADQVK